MYVTSTFATFAVLFLSDNVEMPTLFCLVVLLVFDCYTLENTASIYIPGLGENIRQEGVLCKDRCKYPMFPTIGTARESRSVEGDAEKLL